MVWTGIILSTACSDPTIPIRAKAYDFDSGGDVFRWPADRLPVRFYADPRGNMRFLVQRAVEAWEEQFLYGEFRGVLVADSLQADVVVLWADSVPPDVPPDTGPPVVACSGEAVAVLDSTGKALAEPIHGDLQVRRAIAASPAQVAACVRRTAIHELGHAIGIFNHSADSTDIMNPTPRVALPSDRDRRTVEVLYHTAPTLAPPPR